MYHSVSELRSSGSAGPLHCVTVRLKRADAVESIPDGWVRDSASQPTEGGIADQGRLFAEVDCEFVASSRNCKSPGSLRE